MSATFAMRIAHISDPHFGTEVAEVRDALLAELRADPPDLVLLTGDITQRARRAQFAAARAFLASLPPVPRVCLAGNHDLPLFDVFTRFTRPYGRFRHYICASLEPSFEDERVAVVSVDATSPWRHTDGAVDARQTAHLAARLRGLRQPFRLVLTHQPLAPHSEDERDDVIHGAPLALQQWVEAGADLFLGGHIHLPYCMPVGAAGGRQALLLQAGTCVSHRIRRGVPNSYNVVVLEQDPTQRRMRVERRDFDAAENRFVPRHHHLAVNAPRQADRAGGEDSWNVISGGSA